MGAISSWFQIVVGTIVGFLVANLVLSISSTIPSSFQSVKRTFQGQQSQLLITSEYKSVDTFLESIERYPQPSKSKPTKSNNPKPSLSDIDSWTKEMQEQQQQQQQAENGYNNDDIINTSETLDDDDDEPGETSLFAENYITESEHNKALASLDYQIGRLIKQISKRDQLLQKSRVETIQAETMIDQLQVEIKGLKADLEAKNKIIIKELQVLHDEKEKLLIHELHAPRLSELTEGFPKDELVDSSHCIDQAETTPSEGKQKAKDIMTYIPPNRRPLSQAY